MPLINSRRSIKVFIAYAYADKKLCLKLEEHLSSLKYSGEITTWRDQEMLAGANWEDQINIHLNEADMILLLVSANFIASKYCWNKELQVALKRCEDGSAQVIPIILRSVSWQDTPLGKLQALPTGAKPVTQWKDRDKAFDNVVQGIRKVIKDLQVASQMRRSPSEERNLDANQEVFMQKRIDEVFNIGLLVARYKKPYTVITNVKVFKDTIQYDEA
jgi:TIR domain